MENKSERRKEGRKKILGMVKTLLGGDLGKIPGEINRKRKYRPDPRNKERQDDGKRCPPSSPSASSVCPLLTKDVEEMLAWDKNIFPFFFPLSTPNPARNGFT
ncbi:hypothetical protein CEXT_594181 [Caerostris extrusa]|uniref:Uncharacterized protein n=1 Tax=Caerostris extrusa TaxID=172846 RepID=A0AAV4T2A4_CAEEX|nr:hypothetical protein CEXT_594181 [Caerostris extrusa]